MVRPLVFDSSGRVGFCSDCPAVEDLPHGQGALCAAVRQSCTDTEDRADEVTAAEKN